MKQVRRSKNYGLASILMLLSAMMLVFAGCDKPTETATEKAKGGTGSALTTGTAALLTPTMGIELPEKYNTPDGMALDADGNIILSMLNKNDNTHPAKILKIDKDNKITEIIDMPKHPVTGIAAPLGLAVAPNGDIYVADCQALGADNMDHTSRLLRVVMKDGKAQKKVEVLVTGFIMANAVAINGDKVYVTETNLDPAVKPLPSGVFAFDIAELSADKVIALKPGGADPHCIAKLETKNEEFAVGANGMGFDPTGKIMYVCNFGDAQVLQFDLDKDGKAGPAKILTEGQGMLCVDGMKVDPKTGDIYIADFLGNAVHKVDPKTGKVTTIAKNGMTDGKDGALDRPSEVCLRDGKVYVANIDLPLADNTYDAPHSISIITLEK